jgi:hypothetical protein
MEYKSHWTTHNGVKIFVADCSEFGTDMDALQSEINHIVKIISQEPYNSVLGVADVSGTYANGDLVKILRPAFSTLNQHIKVRALVGLGGIRKHLLLLLNLVTDTKRYTLFDTMEEALDWLARQ